MKYLIQTIFLLIVHLAISQEIAESVLKTKIENVTVFIQGAEITRTGISRIPKGESIIKVTNLSPFINPKSITATAKGDFVILSVSHKLNYLNELESDQKVDSLRHIIKSLELKISKIRNDQDVLNEKMDLLHANKDFGGDNGVSLPDLKNAVEYFEDQISKIKSETLSNDLKIEELKEVQNSIQNEIKSQHSKKKLPTSEIHIKVKSAVVTTGQFEIKYPVDNAGWFPKYDIRVDNINKPMLLEYKADIFQNTGVDWANVKLQLSTADPNQSNILPELNTWHLNFERNTVYQKRDYSIPSNLMVDENKYRTVQGKVMDDSGEGIPGVNVIVKGTTRGTTTNFDGNYQITVSGEDVLVFSFVGFASQSARVGNESNINTVLGATTELQEVVVTGYGTQSSNNYFAAKPKTQVITTRVVQKTTSYLFAVELPYSIKSTGERLTVDLKSHALEAEYRYYSIPKIDSDAFLIAELTNWNQYNLLEGEANLFFEGTFVGQTILNPQAFGDTLDISLGRDKSISIEREPITEYSKNQLIGGNKVESRVYLIKVKNLKTDPIELIVYDQIPVAAINTISVSLLESSDGQLNEENGKVTWEMKIDSEQYKEKKLSYQVKYPKNERIKLE